MNFVELCKQHGAMNVEEVLTESLTFSPELRPLCEMNSCGRYNRNYTCPPMIGQVEDLIAKVRALPHAVVMQNIYTLEDSFDFEGMMEGQENHNSMTLRIADAVYAAVGRENALVLGAGGCTICEECGAVTGVPCRFPDRAIASVEAHGMNVSLIGAATGMKYINGANTVTYFSTIFYRNTGE